MTEGTPRQRLESWVDREDNVTLDYTWEKVPADAGRWTVTVEFKGTIERTVVLAGAASSLDKASAAVIEGLGTYGIDVP